MLRAARSFATLIALGVEGTILNNVASYKHELVLIRNFKTKVLGLVPTRIFNVSFRLKQRHLGIVGVYESYAKPRAVVSKIGLQAFYFCNLENLKLFCC